jgi:hypothetical protein
MRAIVNVHTQMWDDLQRHLFKSAFEESAMLYADVSQNDGGIQFNVVEAELLGTDDYDFQSSYHISLKDDTKGRIIKRAWDSKRAIVEVHSHVGELAIAAFSPSDLSGFDEYVPHVMWRLRGIPYAAIVATERGFDGKIWLSEQTPCQQLDMIRVGDIELPAAAAATKMGGMR